MIFMGYNNAYCSFEISFFPQMMWPKWTNFVHMNHVISIKSDMEKKFTLVIRFFLKRKLVVNKILNKIKNCWFLIGNNTSLIWEVLMCILDDQDISSSSSGWEASSSKEFVLEIPVVVSKFGQWWIFTSKSHFPLI